MQQSPDQMPNALVSIVTADYIAEAMTAYSYIGESNPETPYLVVILGEKKDLFTNLPNGPQWIWWEEMLDINSRIALAKEFTPFELSCVARGRVHLYMSTRREFNMWLLIDTDICVLGDLTPLWSLLESSDILITTHASKPVSPSKAIPHEANLLRTGIYNGGVMGMRRSDAAHKVALWLVDRLERYGHAYPHRKVLGLKTHHEFEFVDQIWLNLLPCYFSDSTLVLANEVFNLGHWNLHQGELRLRDGIAYFNDEKVIILHFSGLPPRESLEIVSEHSQLYHDRPSEPWAVLAAEYLDRLEHAKNSITYIPYSYANIQPKTETKEAHSLDTASANEQRSVAKGILRKLARAIQSPKKMSGGLKLACWQVKRACQVAQVILTKNWEAKICHDQSPNAFTKLVPCIGNYETYIIRRLILNAVSKAKAEFHGKLLDVGAGSSPYAELIMADNRVTQYLKLDLAVSNYHSGHDLDLTWDGETVPVDSNSIDTVLMTEVLEHVRNPASLLQEVNRVLKPGGVLFLTVPFIWPIHELPFDYHRFTPIALRRYLEEAGFRVQKIDMLGGWDHSLAQHIGLWLTNRRMDAKKRKMIMLLVWPIYHWLIRRGENEITALQNHQMYIGLAAVANA